jgi:hypothetical protein
LHTTYSYIYELLASACKHLGLQNEQNDNDKFALRLWKARFPLQETKIRELVSRFEAVQPEEDTEQKQNKRVLIRTQGYWKQKVRAKRDTYLNTELVVD